MLKKLAKKISVCKKMFYKDFLGDKMGRKFFNKLLIKSLTYKIKKSYFFKKNCGAGGRWLLLKICREEISRNICSA